jgi:hypothetical protein
MPIIISGMLVGRAQNNPRIKPTKYKPEIIGYSPLKKLPLLLSQIK